MDQTASPDIMDRLVLMMGRCLSLNNSQSQSSNSDTLDPKAPASVETRTLDQLAEEMGYYFYLTEFAASKIRHLPDLVTIHEKAAQEWKDDTEFWIPPKNDELKRQRYLAMCQDACDTTPLATPEG